MAVTTARIDMKDLYLYILTRQAVNGSLSYHGFKFSQGDFNYSVKRGYEFITDRGLLSTGSVRQTDEVPCDAKFEGEYQTVFADSGTPSPYEIIMGEGDCAGWAGLGQNMCEPYASWLVIVNDPLIRLPNCGAGEGLLFKYFFCEGADFGVKNGTTSFAGKCKQVAPSKISNTDGSFLELSENVDLEGSDQVVWTFPGIHDHS